ncbi:outer membrane lipoprotein carrier protein LolA [Deinococcus lacus]|uniref:Outer membrane lipoprotein carrier protein LolA n=1 Tax=Deinococcus lacus TaxID=392561 RepID=A0ABW1YCP2_9DEIO
MGVKKTLLLLALGLPFASAGAQTAQDVVYKVNQMQKNARDVTFRLTGTLSAGGTPQKMDIRVRSIPSQGLARMEFAAPASIAGDIIVSDKNEVRQYFSLTNQIAVTPVNKAAASTGLGLDFVQVGNAANLSDSYNLRLLGVSGGSGSRVFQLEASPKAGNSGKSRIWVTEQGWRPTRVQMLDARGQVLVDLSVSAFKTNSGVTSAVLRALPKSARIVRQ